MTKEEILEFLIKNNVKKELISNNAFKIILAEMEAKFKEIEGEIKVTDKKISVGEKGINKTASYYEISIDSNSVVQIIERQATSKENGSIRSNDKKTIINEQNYDLIVKEYFESIYLDLRTAGSKYNTDYVRFTKKYDEDGIEYEELQQKWFRENNISSDATDIISGASLEKMEDKRIISSFDDPTFEEVKKIRMYPDVMRVIAEGKKYYHIDVYFEIPYKNTEVSLKGLDIGTDFSNIESLIKPIDKLDANSYSEMNKINGMDKYCKARYGVKKERIDFSYSVQELPKYGM